MIDQDDKTLIRCRVEPAKLPPVPIAQAKSARPVRPPGSTQTNPTHSSWSNPGAWAGSGEPPLTTGSVIKKRFVLAELIGRGGMGTVYRARDLRKVEAQDRNPYVAIKVLNEDFKQHPGALQALQREARKSQKLAHPNIVTVFDFDRDGANVYMVMELLEGEPLDRLIKRKKDEGLGAKDAVAVTRGICRALQYAHEQGITHADFKPANAFLTASGGIKVLDFGIARAANVKDRPDANGVTRFDPGTLGALTPTYAGCEVIEGQAPDPSDDIYAIACVTYELITGAHPFNRLSASQAEKAHMTPDRPPGLSARQWRALRRALSFRRAGRPKSAGELMDELQPFNGTPAVYAAMGMVGLVALALVSVPIFSQIDRFRERSMIAALASADAHRIEPRLDALRMLEPTRRASLFMHDDARAGLIKYYSERVTSLVDVSNGRSEYSRAESLVHELEGFFPDSEAVRNIRDHVASKKSEELRHLSDAFELDLQHRWLVPAQNPECVTNVLARVRQIDSTSRLLSDPRLSGAFAESASRALKSGQPALAGALVTAGLAAAPGDTALTDLHGQAQRALTDRSSAAQIAAAARQREDSPAQWRMQLEEGLGRPTLSLGQARTLLHLSEELQRHGDTGVATMRGRLAALLVHSAAALQVKEGLDTALTFTKDAYALFPDSAELGRTLMDLQAAVAQRASTERATAIASATGETEALLARPTLDDSWDEALQRHLETLRTYTPETNSYIDEIKGRAATLYVTQAARLRGTKQFDEAGRMLARALEYPSQSTDLAVEETLLADARAKDKIGSSKSERAAYVNSLKQKLLTQATADDVAPAEMSLRVLRENLPAGDRFLTREGPEAIAQAYGRLALKVAGNGQFKSAVELMTRARAAAPAAERIAITQARYVRYQEIDDYLTDAAVPDIRRVRTEISELYAQDPHIAQVLVPILARDLASRLHTTADPQLAVRLSEAGNAIFGDGPPFRRD
jgi:serine/threonine protein kinase